MPAQAHRAALFPVLAALLATAALACGGGDDRVPGSFRLEATAEVTGRDGEVQVTAIAWWYEPSGRWRFELTGDAGAIIGVSDGERWWLYDSEAHTYTVQSVPPGAAQPFLPISLWIGPALEADVGAFIDALAARAGGWARSAGETRLLERDVVIIEYGPIWASSDGDGRERFSGEGRIAIDPETMFILRNEISGQPGANATITVTLLELGVRLPDERFEFEPPDGARRVEE